MVNSFLKQYLVYFIPFYVSRHVCPDTWGAPHLPNCPHGSLSPLSCPCLPLIFHTSWKPYIRPSSTYGPSSSKSVAYSISFLKESLKVLVSWEPVSSLRTFSSMKSCQMMALFLPQTSHHVSCMYKVSISFHGCFLSFFLIFPKKPNYKPCVIVIVQPPVIPPNFCVDLSSWLIIIIFSTAPALFCDDTKIHQDNYFNSLALGPLDSSPLRIFSALPHCYNVFIFSVCVHLDFWSSPPIFITLSLQSFWDLWSIDPITFSVPCISDVLSFLHGQSF